MTKRQNSGVIRIFGALIILAGVAGCGVEESHADNAVAPIGSEPGNQGIMEPDVIATPTLSDVNPTTGVKVYTTGLVTVLDSGTGPELCTSVAESYPPQCSGPEIIGWNWDEILDYEQASGVRWGEYQITGHYNPTTQIFTLSQAIPRAMFADNPPPGDQVDFDFTTPCAAPEGGWQVIDPAKTNEEAWQAAGARAMSLPGYASSWIDQSRNEANTLLLSDDAADLSDEQRLALESQVNDPNQFILNVRVAGDTASAEAALREVWGGMLCVSRAERSAAQVAEIQDEIRQLPEVLAAYANPTTDQLIVSVIFDDGSLRQQLNDTYGPGSVLVLPVLQPVTGG